MTIEEIREKIDSIDAKIIPLLEERFLQAEEVVPYKKDVEDLSREEAILKKIDNTYIEKIYGEIFKQSKLLQKKSQ
jgi:chorismate mutase